jgi:ferredoxin
LKQGKISETDYVRRDFIVQIAAWVAALAGSAVGQNKIVPKKPSKIITGSKYPVSPPGSAGVENFTDSCTACHLCISACPTQVLQPSFLEYGFLGMMQPRMDYKTAFCDFECVICTQVCPSGAILPTALATKKLLQLGKAKFEKDNCIVYTEKTDCGACAEHCPTKAVTMVPHENLKAPEVKDEFCIGCGACEYACPTKPYKAIFVESNLVHQKAEKKKVEKIEKKIDYKDDFPF